ncbi:hypothetical protein BN1058_00244 [Paraliobacillus sp. PM-2]|uniref:DUF1836 domain-containing protein n=1 Tax=Paraliobacillus sp. PM-2 TaxID=1462524 RepID=UPI00061CBD1F|nr:DUF1836 domain-containing protein [Paraliobacillus sp. PM-2]CQR46001.1 hypothetical protein BN1058_00244 [Paraliobacillus sp. PM-2]
MDDLTKLMEKMALNSQVRLEDIPTIDLYMDQVTQLFENTYHASKRNENDKVLTKTMINNYAKGKLLFPIKNKKYSKEHIMLIQLIYQLKGALSINDVRIVLEKLNRKIDTNQLELEPIYQHYIQMQDEQIETFNDAVTTLYEDVQAVLGELEISDKDYMEQLLLVTSFINMSNMYRKLAERIVDQIEETKEKK